MECTQIKAVIFDMDGVLLDSETVSWKTWEIAAQEYGLKDIKIANSKCMGTNKTDTYAILHSIYGKDFPAEQFLARTSELFYEIEKESGISLMPYAKESLEYLSKKYTIALASSTRKEAVFRQMKNTGLFDFFKTITTGDMVIHSKPAPEIYLLALNSINVTEKEAVAIEDSPNGIKSAYNAGLRTIMIPDKIQPDDEIKNKAWKIIPSLKEISKIL